jgi:hypothetical protein
MKESMGNGKHKKPVLGTSGALGRKHIDPDLPQPPTWCPKVFSRGPTSEGFCRRYLPSFTSIHHMTMLLESRAVPLTSIQLTRSQSLLRTLAIQQSLHRWYEASMRARKKVLDRMSGKEKERKREREDQCQSVKHE